MANEASLERVLLEVEQSPGNDNKYSSEPREKQDSQIRKRCAGNGGQSEVL